MTKRMQKTEKGKVHQTKRRRSADSKSLTRVENLGILFMYQELLGRGLAEWEKKKTR